jgi:PAS domain S-box-containing protein
MPTDSRAQRALLANLRHELRTPINAIIGYSEMLLEELEDAGEQACLADLQNIQACGTQLLSLVNTILDPVKLEASQFNLNLATFGETIRVELRTPLNTVIGYCELLLEEATAELIPDLQKIHTAAQHLLTMINDIVNLSERQLQRSDANEAGTPHLTLESAAASALVHEVVTTIPSLEADTPREPVVAQGKILVVDDNETNADLLSRQLERQGYTVAVAGNGQQALRMVEAQRYDLMLLDIIMPEMNGYEVLERLKTHDTLRHIPVIMISALDEIESVVRCIQSGAEDYLPKPFNPVLLRARIGACLEKKRLRDQEIVYLAQLSQAHTEITSLNERLQADNAQLQELNEQLQIQIVERQRAEEKYRSIYENTDEGLFQTTLEGKVISANPALARIFGYQSPEELIAELTQFEKQLYVDPNRRAEFLRLMQEHGKVSGFESQVYRTDGSIIWISENAHVVRDDRGQLLYFEGSVVNNTERKVWEEALRYQQQGTEQLLLNILPEPIAQRLKLAESNIADSFAEVTVLFADLVNFTELSAQIPATELVSFLNKIFSAFDQLAEKHGLEKIKTIGDAYMVVGGLPTPRADHAQAIAEMALEMQEAIAQLQNNNGKPFRLRIGINTGPVVAGVIGMKKFIYDLWGDTVNVASRMESQGLPGGIQVTQTTYELLEDKYIFQSRGAIAVKGKGEMTTYLLIGPKANFNPPN